MPKIFKFWSKWWNFAKSGHNALKQTNNHPNSRNNIRIIKVKNVHTKVHFKASMYTPPNAQAAFKTTDTPNLNSHAETKQKETLKRQKHPQLSIPTL